MGDDNTFGHDLGFERPANRTTGVTSGCHAARAPCRQTHRRADARIFFKVNLRLLEQCKRDTGRLSFPIRRNAQTEKALPFLYVAENKDNSDDDNDNADTSTVVVVLVRVGSLHTYGM